MHAYAQSGLLVLVLVLTIFELSQNTGQARSQVGFHVARKSPSQLVTA